METPCYGDSLTWKTCLSNGTGSAFKAMDVVVACLSYEMGGGLEEGGLPKNVLQKRPADFPC